MEKWTTVISFPQPHEAHLVCGFLASEGIETNIVDEFTVQVHNFYSNAIGGVKIQVMEADLEKGLKILEKGGYIVPDASQPKRIIELVDIKVHPDKSTCPFCTSDNVGRNREPNMLAIFMYIILSIVFPIFKRNYLCFDCGKEWKYKPK